MASAKRNGPDTLLGVTIAGRYRIISQIARGGMGKVYKAEQSALGRNCALKVLAPNQIASQDPGFFRRFSLEAATAARLTHPNTVTVFDYGHDESSGVVFIAMEYIAGRTLHKVLQQEGALPEDRANRIARQICRSLAEAHELGIVHRDLKPGNVLLVDRADEVDFVKVVDFGLVKDVSNPSEQLTQNGFFLGSPKYISPEQITGAELTPRADIYSLGIVLYEMLCGKLPFAHDTNVALLMAQIHTAPPALTQHAPGLAISPDMEAIVMRCLEKDPEKRFPTMRDCLLALKAAAGESEGVPSSTPRRLESPRSMPITLKSLSPVPPDPDAGSPPEPVGAPSSSRPDVAPSVPRVHSDDSVTLAQGALLNQAPALPRSTPPSAAAAEIPRQRRFSSLAVAALGALLGGVVTLGGTMLVFGERMTQVVPTSMPAVARSIAMPITVAAGLTRIAEPSVVPAPSAAPAAPAATAPEVLLFQDGMTRPVPILAPTVTYTREARQAKVEGTVLARCVLTTAGTPTDCRILKGVSHLNTAVLSALASSRYTPIMFQGRPVNVEYVFAVKLVLS